MSRSLLLALLTFAFASTAVAQEIDPETGEVYVPPEEETPPPPEEETPPPVDTTSEQPAWYQGGPTGQQTQQQPATEPSTSASTTVEPVTAGGDAGEGEGEDDGLDDHERVVGRLAVGFLGAATVPVGSPGGAPVTVDTVTAPALGVRYWLGDLVGLDVGVGIGYLGGTATTGMTSTPVDNAFAMNLHAGLPLAVFHEEHYKFLIIPETNFGFSTGTAFGASPDQDRGRGGILFQIGGRVGTEIHFGFMDVPQLSLQASVGLFFEYIGATVGQSNSGATPETSVATYGLGTSVQGEPWDILLGALNALYYF